MAQTATIHSIQPFDSTKGTIIYFTWTGNQIHKVRCIIKKNETNETVYDETISGMTQEFTLSPTDKLTNGEYYIVYITVFDVDGVESDLQSIGTPFYCFTTPEFKLSIKDSDVIRASTYAVGITYSQTENELLDSYKISLYSYSMNILQDSGTIVNTSDLSYIISRLENAKQYYIRATGTTIHGITIDTGYILFSVSYEQAQVFSPLEVNNMPNIGAIEIKSNIISAKATSEKDVVYIDNDRIDLRDNSITYDIGFEVDGDCSGIYLFEKPNLNTPIVKFLGEKTNAEVIYREGSFSNSNGTKAYFELRILVNDRYYILLSNYINIPTENQQISLLVNRENNLYDIKAVTVEKGGTAT